MVPYRFLAEIPEPNPGEVGEWVDSLDRGLGAGHDGGRILSDGTHAAFVVVPNTRTGEHLAACVGP